MYYEAIGPHRFKFHTLGGFCGLYFYQTDAQSPRYKMLRMKHIDKFLSNLLIILSLIVIGHFFIVLGLIYELFCQHNRVTLMAIHLPFFDEDSDIGFTLNTILQLIMGLYAFFGSIAIEIASCMINDTITVTPELIQYNLTEFHEEFHGNGINQKSICLLRNCFVQIQDFNRYVKCTIEKFYLK